MRELWWRSNKERWWTKNSIKTYTSSHLRMSFHKGIDEGTVQAVARSFIRRHLKGCMRMFRSDCAEERRLCSIVRERKRTSDSACDRFMTSSFSWETMHVLTLIIPFNQPDIHIGYITWMFFLFYAQGEKEEQISIDRHPRQPKRNLFTSPQSSFLNDTFDWNTDLVLLTS